jgi:hypothetical protein
VGCGGKRANIGDFWSALRQGCHLGWFGGFLKADIYEMAEWMRFNTVEFRTNLWLVFKGLGQLQLVLHDIQARRPNTARTQVRNF